MLALIHFNLGRADGQATWASMRTSKFTTNYGDVLVCDAILRQLKIAKHYFVGFGGAVHQDCTKFLVRGSTYLHNEFDFAKAMKTLESTNCEGTIVGLGAQSPTLDLSFLDSNNEARSFVSLLNERCKSISVRGQFTADLVERLGGRNVRITGCPSLFHGRRIPNITVPFTFGTSERSVGISTHTGLGGIFCRNPAASLKAHAFLIDQSLRTSRLIFLFEQGARLEFAVADRERPYEERILAAQDVVRRIGSSLPPERLLSMYSTIETIEEWRGKVHDLDAMIGFRFHGNMVALMQGRPCYYVVYDSRLEEFCRLYQLPFQDVSEKLRPFEMIAEHDWGKTNKALAHCGAEMKDFWIENGFTHLIQ
jgi:hypothetical protein